jgi:hypothetical protein
MINLKDLISLLPLYFKDNDTYKDNEDKGILERFLSIFGDYFKDDIQPDIDTMIGIIDIEDTDPKFINFIWELFGAVPYAYGVMMSNAAWNTYNPRGPNDISSWKEITTEQNPRPDFRKLLKYIIPLYKVKGTLDFYPLLLSFFGYDCKVVDSTGDYDNPDPIIPSREYIPRYDTGVKYDTDLTYDLAEESCLKCKDIELYITTHHTITPEFKNLLTKLLNKYRPIYISPLIFEASHIQPGSSRVRVYEDTIEGFPLVLPTQLNT